MIVVPKEIYFIKSIAYLLQLWNMQRWFCRQQPRIERRLYVLIGLHSVSYRQYRPR